MQKEIDWRHLVGAGVLLVLLVMAGWMMVNRPAELPRAEAPAGPNARLQDAPELPPVGTGLPRAH